MGPAELAAALRSNGVSVRVMHAMADLPREEFVPHQVRRQAWEDHPLPIGYGQTISQPSLVGLMTDLLDVGPGDRVLDVGTGSGYQAALLAKLGAEVHSLERIGALAERATATFQRLGLAVEVHQGDGSLGLPERAPFDAIVVSAAAESVPEALAAQLVEATPGRRGGRLLLPINDDYGLAQTLVLVERTTSGLVRRDLMAVVFVPLVVGR